MQLRCVIDFVERAEEYRRLERFQPKIIEVLTSDSHRTYRQTWRMT